MISYYYLKNPAFGSLCTEEDRRRHLARYHCRRDLLVDIMHAIYKQMEKGKIRFTAQTVNRGVRMYKVWWIPMPTYGRGSTSMKITVKFGICEDGSILVSTRYILHGHPAELSLLSLPRLTSLGKTDDEVSWMAIDRVDCLVNLLTDRNALHAFGLKPKSKWLANLRENSRYQSIHRLRLEKPCGIRLKFLI